MSDKPKGDDGVKEGLAGVVAAAVTKAAIERLIQEYSFTRMERIAIDPSSIAIGWRYITSQSSVSLSRSQSSSLSSSTFSPPHP